MARHDKKQCSHGWNLAVAICVTYGPQLVSVQQYANEE